MKWQRTNKKVKQVPLAINSYSQNIQWASTTRAKAMNAGRAVRRKVDIGKMEGYRRKRIGHVLKGIRRYRGVIFRQRQESERAEQGTPVEEVTGVLLLMTKCRTASTLR